MTFVVGLNHPNETESVTELISPSMFHCIYFISSFKIKKLEQEKYFPDRFDHMQLFMFIKESMQTPSHIISI